jgi:hypothetical protein
MNVSELAQKNRRVKFWKETLNEGSLTVAQKTEMNDSLKAYQELIAVIVEQSTAENSLVPEGDSIKLLNLERKLEQLAEAARLESGKSSLLA